MEIEIRNFLGIKEAHIPLVKGPCIVIGPNASGKTSIATAIAGILSRNHNPLGLGTTAKPYINDEADHGEVVLRGPDAMEYRRWILEERGIRIIADVEKDCNIHALGLTDFINLSTKARAETWEQAFLPPNKVLIEMVGKDLKEQIAQETVVEDVLRHLRTSRWTDVHTIFAHKAREAKQEWQGYTGVHYGSKKADLWTPQPWRSEWDNITPAEARSQLEAAREMVRMRQIGQAVQEADTARAKAAKMEIPGLEKEVNDFSHRLSEERKVLSVSEKKYNVIRDEGIKVKSEHESHDRSKPEREHTVPCPACGDALVIGPGDTLSRAKDESAFEAHMQAWEMGRESLWNKLEALRAQARVIKVEEIIPQGKVVAELQKKHSAASSLLTIARRDSKMEDSEVFTEADVKALAAAEQAVEDAQSAAQGINRKTNAHNAHMSVLNYSSIAVALGPKGVRSRAMQENMNLVKKYLHHMAESFVWPRVELDSTYAVMVNGRYGALCSGSERWRARFMIQCAIALAKKETRVIADGADILDQVGAEQMFSLCDWLKTRGVYAIVCATGTISGVPSSWEMVRVSGGVGE